MRPPPPVPSGTETPSAVTFAPNAESLDAVIALLAEHGAPDDAALRREALARVEVLPAPGARPSRGWKYDYANLPYDELVWTSGRVELPAMPQRPVVQPRASADETGDVDRPALATENAGGVYHMGATFVDAPGNVDPRVTLLPLDATTARDFAAQLGGVMHEIVDWRADKFAALTTAFRNCGAFVYVPAGVQLDLPLQLIFANTEARDEAVFPHVVVVLGKGARATVIERQVGEGDPFVCGIAEAHLAEGAELDYVAVQQAGEAARVMFSRGARCERDAQIRWHLAELGGALARTVLGARLESPGGRAEASALFFNTGTQHVDLTSGVDHTVGPTFSDTVVRSAAPRPGRTPAPRRPATTRCCSRSARTSTPSPRLRSRPTTSRRSTARPSVRSTRTRCSTPAAAGSRAPRRCG